MVFVMVLFNNLKVSEATMEFENIFVITPHARVKHRFHEIKNKKNLSKHKRILGMMKK